MMMNMFSIFDPKTNLIQFNMMLILFILHINMKFWKNNFNKNIILNKNKSTNMIFISNMTSLFMINMINLIPLNFSLSNNIMLTINMTLNMWMMMMLFMMINNLNIMFMNFSPKMTKLNMIMIINIIELNSMMFMIMSLSMRLMINMMMSHIIIFMMKIKYMIYLYMMIEMMIILIQTYVFFILNLINFNNMM